MPKTENLQQFVPQKFNHVCSSAEDLSGPSEIPVKLFFQIDPLGTTSGTSPTKNMTELWLMNCLRITGSYLKNFRGIFIKFYKKKLKTSFYNRSKVFDVSLFGILSHNHPTNIQNGKPNEIFIIKNYQKNCSEIPS